jgi:hypothetical protein
MSSILTSKNNLLQLPIKLNKLSAGEQIVATDAYIGMLYIEESSETVHDLSELDQDKLPNGTPLIVKYVEDMRSIEGVNDVAKYTLNFDDSL